MAPYDTLKSRTRDNYPFLLDYRTRWSDNDMYAHVNNSTYNILIDSVINAYLVQHAGLDPVARQPQYGLVVHSHTDYFAPLAFPDVAELGLRVARLGRSSAHYEVAVFMRGTAAVRAVGRVVHVFADAATGRPNAQTGIHPRLRQGLERILVKLEGDEDDEGGEDAGGSSKRDSSGGGGGMNKGNKQPSKL